MFLLPSEGSSRGAVPTCPEPAELASVLARGIGIEYGDRANGLDDFRRYWSALRDALTWSPRPVVGAELRDRVLRIQEDQPFRRIHELVERLSATVAPAPDEPVASLCQRLRAGATKAPGVEALAVESAP